MRVGVTRPQEKQGGRKEEKETMRKISQGSACGFDDRSRDQNQEQTEV